MFSQNFMKMRNICIYCEFINRRMRCELKNILSIFQMVLTNFFLFVFNQFYSDVTNFIDLVIF